MWNRRLFHITYSITSGERRRCEQASGMASRHALREDCRKIDMLPGTRYTFYKTGSKEVTIDENAIYGHQP